MSFVKIDLTQEMWKANPKERLAVNTSTMQFALVGRTVKPPSGFTTSLKAITQRVNEMVRYKPISCSQALTLATNAQTLNRLFSKHNTKINGSCFLNCLDVIVWIVTFGFVTLRAAMINIDALKSRTPIFQDVKVPQSVHSELLHWFDYDHDRIALFPNLVRKRLLTLDPAEHKLKSIAEKERYLEILNAYIKKYPADKLEDIYIPTTRLLVLLRFLEKNPTFATSIPEASALLLSFVKNVDAAALTAKQKSRLLGWLESLRKREATELTSLQFSSEALVALLECGFSRIGKPELLESLLLQLLGRFSSLSTPMKQRCEELVQQAQQHNTPVNISLEQLDRGERKELLKYLALNSQDENIALSALSQKLYECCFIQYSMLDADEKSSFFSLMAVHDEALSPLATSREMLFDFMASANANNMALSDVQKGKLLTNAKALSSWTDPEKSSVLKFILKENLFNQLSRERIIELLPLLAAQKDLVTEHQNVVFAMCQSLGSPLPASLSKIISEIYTHINAAALPLNIFREFIQSAIVQADPETYFMAIKLSKLSEDKFTQLTRLDAFQKNADAYLYSANDEQIDAYWEPFERNLQVDRRHIQTAAAEAVALPPLPAGASPQYDDLTKWFDEINFTVPGRADYYDPRTIKDDYDQPADPAWVRRGLVNFINVIKNRLVYVGAPPFSLPDGRPNPEFPVFYDKLQLCVKHVILELAKLSKEERAAYLVTLGIGGHQCAMRFKRDSMAIFSSLSGIGCENDSIRDTILKALVQLRHHILHKFATMTNSDVHYVNAVMRTVGPLVGAGEEDSENDDVYVPWELDPRNRRRGDTIKAIVEEFYKGKRVGGKVIPGYVPTQMLSAVARCLNNPKNTAHQDYRDKISEELKSRAARDIDASEFLSQMLVWDEHGYRIKRQGLTFMLQALKAIQTPAPPPRAAAPAAAAGAAAAAPAPQRSLLGRFLGLFGL